MYKFAIFQCGFEDQRQDHREFHQWGQRPQPCDAVYPSSPPRRRYSTTGGKNQYCSMHLVARCVMPRTICVKPKYSIFHKNICVRQKKEYELERKPKLTLPSIKPKLLSITAPLIAKNLPGSPGSRLRDEHGRVRLHHLHRVARRIPQRRRSPVRQSST